MTDKRSTPQGEALTPQQIEACRVNPTQAMIERQRLCELALDGLLFRAWVNGAEQNACKVAVALSKCSGAQQHRDAITRLVAEGSIRW